MRALVTLCTASALALLPLSGCGGCVESPAAPGTDAGPGARVLSLEIVEEETTLTSLGASVQLTARVLGDDGEPVDDVEVRWATSDPTVLSVSDDGTFTAEANGEVNVTARIASEDEDAAEATARVIVRQAPAALELDGREGDAPLVLWQLGKSPMPSATWRDANDHALERADATVTWRSLDEGVVEVGPGDAFTAHEDGNATLVAAFDGFEVQVPVEVRAGLVLTSCAGFEDADGEPRESCASLPLTFVEAR